MIRRANGVADESRRALIAYRAWYLKHDARIGAVGSSQGSPESGEAEVD